MSLRPLAVVEAAAAFILALVSVSSASVGFQPVSQEELKMSSEPEAPGAPAIILYRQVDRDDYGRNYHGGMHIAGEAAHDDRYEDDYVRIKVFTEAGRQLGNVEIPYNPAWAKIGVIRGRTIHPDGSVVEFDGRMLDKFIVKGKGTKYLARTFALPDVQVGSIIEYFYTVNFIDEYIFDSHWVVSQPLFTKKARFSLKPYNNDYVPYSFRGVAHLTPEPKIGSDGIVRLETANVPAFQEEDFMPPEDELKARVDFIYSRDPFEMDVNKFWKKVGKKRNDELEHFVGKRGAMEQAVAQIVSPGDSPEAKLQKIYDRVQQLRNTSYEVRKTEEELKRDKEKPAETVEDVWRQGYGSDWQLNWLYLALARAAGFEAYGVWVSDRRRYFFDPQTMASGRLDANVVLVKSNGKDLYLDPGSAFTPFGLLKWEETGVQGLRLDKDGGTWIQTAVPDSSACRIERRARLKLSDKGDVEGRLTVTYTGLEALRRRVEERNQDDTERKKYLEEEVSGFIPAGSDVELSNKPDWSTSSNPLVAEFNLKVGGWASSAGQRAILPVGFFSASERHLFDHAERVHPVYFESPAVKLDDVIIEFPPGWQVMSLPQAQDQDVHVVAYALAAENSQGTVHLTRKLNINIILLDTKYYGPLRSFFQTVKAGDEQQIVLQRNPAVSTK